MACATATLLGMGALPCDDLLLLFVDADGERGRLSDFDAGVVYLDASWPW